MASLSEYFPEEEHLPTVPPWATLEFLKIERARALALTIAEIERDELTELVEKYPESQIPGEDERKIRYPEAFDPASNPVSEVQESTVSKVRDSQAIRDLEPDLCWEISEELRKERPSLKTKLFRRNPHMVFKPRLFQVSQFTTTRQKVRETLKQLR